MRSALLLSGGGLKTLPFLGVLACLREKQFKVIGGVSFGSLIALLYSYNIDNSRFMKVLAKTPEYENIMKLDFSFSRLLRSGAVIQCSKVLDIMRHILSECGIDTNITFRKHFIQTGVKLRIFAATLYDHQIVALDVESFPDVSIVLAICAAVAVPFVFECVEISGTSYIDAGIVNNLPLHLMGHPKRLMALDMYSEQNSNCTLSKRFRTSLRTRSNFMLKCSRHVAHEALLLTMPYIQGLNISAYDDLNEAVTAGRLAIVMNVLNLQIIVLFALTIIFCPQSVFNFLKNMSDSYAK